MIYLTKAFYCECCGHLWIDNDDTPYVKCEQCGAKEERDVAEGLLERI